MAVGQYLMSPFDGKLVVGLWTAMCPYIEIPTTRVPRSVGLHLHRFPHVTVEDWMRAHRSSRKPIWLDDTHRLELQVTFTSFLPLFCGYAFPDGNLVAYLRPSGSLILDKKTKTWR